jgi:hypothetical protein
MRRVLPLARTVLILVCGLPILARADIAEVEPNNTLPQADAGPRVAGSEVIAGGISPVGDFDLFRVDLPAQAAVRFQSFDFSGTGCAGLATVLRLYDGIGSPLEVDSSGLCAAFTMVLAPGTYYISIEDRENNALILGYKLAITLFASAGNESEPNDSATTGNAVPGRAFHVGGEATSGDLDYFAITVPEGAAVRVEMIPDPAHSASCEVFIDAAQLMLEVPGQGLLVFDVESGRNGCPMIDGVRLHPQARNLPGGVYAVGARTASNSFGYRLVVEILPPDFIFGDDFDAAAARVVINEFDANITSPLNCDLIELRVVSGGSMDGISLWERNTQLVFFDGLTVSTGDIIVVHVDSTDPACNPTAATSETTSTTQFASSAHPLNYDTAYDWYSIDTGLTNTDNVFTLYGSQGQIMDAVLTADDPTGTAAAASEDQAAAVAAAGEWQMVGGGVPAAGFVDDEFCAHAVLDLNATGPNASGTSIQRNTNVDSNDKNGWTTGTGAPSSWGLPNAGQSPF